MSPPCIHCSIAWRNAGGFRADGWKRAASAADAITASRPRAKRFWPRSAVVGRHLWRQSTGLRRRNMPDWREEITKRFSSLKLNPTREVEIIQELTQHLEDRYHELVSGGDGRGGPE